MQTIRSSLDLNSKEEVNITKVANSKDNNQSSKKISNNLGRWPCYKYIIYIYKKISCSRNCSFDKQRYITLWILETLLKKEGSEPAEPSTRCLFEIIKRASKTTYMIGEIRIYKPQGLPHVYFFIECAVQKCIANFKLFDNPIIRVSNWEHSAYVTVLITGLNVSE